MKWESVASNYLRRLYNLSFPTFSKTYNGLVVVKKGIWMKSL
jgi:hypothetical protein